MLCEFPHFGSQAGGFHSFCRLPELVARPWSTSGPKPFYLSHCRIIDAAKGEVLSGERVIKIENGLIASVHSDTDTASIDASLETYSLKGKFLCPGLIDAHVHIAAVPGISVSGTVFVVLYACAGRLSLQTGCGRDGQCR